MQGRIAKVFSENQQGGHYINAGLPFFLEEGFGPGGEGFLD